MRILIFIGLFFTLLHPTYATAQGRLLSTGTASFRPNRALPNTTADGSVYDPNSYTAAHRFLPFGTRVRVVNPANRKEVTVVINDRGPFEHSARIIDVSYVAGQSLGMTGIANVQLYVLDQVAEAYYTLPANFEKWTIQVASVADVNVANQLLQRLGVKAFKASFEVQGRTMYRIFYGKYNRRAEMQGDKATLRRRGFQPIEKYLLDEHFALAL